MKTKFYYTTLLSSIFSLCYIAFYMTFELSINIHPETTNPLSNWPIVNLVIMVVMWLSTLRFGYIFKNIEAEATKARTLREIDNRVNQLIKFTNLAQSLVNKDTKVIVNNFISELKKTD